MRGQAVSWARTPSDSPPPCPQEPPQPHHRDASAPSTGAPSNSTTITTDSHPYPSPKPCDSSYGSTGSDGCSQDPCGDTGRHLGCGRTGCSQSPCGSRSLSTGGGGAEIPDRRDPPTQDNAPRSGSSRSSSSSLQRSCPGCTIRSSATAPVTATHTGLTLMLLLLSAASCVSFLAPPAAAATTSAALSSATSSTASSAASSAVIAALASLTRYIGNLTYPLDEQLSYCDTLDGLYDGIAHDLRHWNNSDGISHEALEVAASRYTTRGAQKGVVLAFYDGVAYVIEEPKLQGLGHHVNIFFTYMLVMLDLQRQYGKVIPDLEFVLASSDKPLVLTAEHPAGRVPPVMRFCSSAEHADIHIPIFHFYTKKYTQRYLGATRDLGNQYPWEARKPVVFGRFSKYYRMVHPGATSTLRLGAGNRSICRKESPHALSCPVRAHFMDWALSHPSVLDVKSGPRVSLEKHAAYKYLLHLDGQALSSRLEQLMPLGSLILKEDSGYTAFYYHLVRPHEHYLPVWKRGSGPEDVLEAFEWAQEHDKEAQRMGTAAQAVAHKYLSKRARSCYWLRLFQAYASLQRFTPSPRDNRGDPGGRPYLVSVAEYLATVGRTFERGGQLHRIEY